MEAILKHLRFKSTSIEVLVNTVLGKMSSDSRLVFVRTVALFASLSVILQGCASFTQKNSKIELPDHSALGHVSITAAKAIPRVELEGVDFETGGTGALANGGLLFFACEDGLGPGRNCSGEFCGPALLFTYGVCGATGLIGGLFSHFSSPATEGDSDIDESILNPAETQSLFREYIEQDLEERGLLNLQDEGPDTLIEVALTKILISGSDIEDPMSLAMEARIAFIRANDHKEIHSASYARIHPEKMRLIQWIGRKGKRLRLAVEDDLRTMSTQFCNELFHLNETDHKAVAF